MKYAVDYINILLMFAACIVSFLVPFELFLFSYAVLGPLHYFTEIGWLHTHGYFTKGKYDFLYMIVFACLILSGYFFNLIQEVHTAIMLSALMSGLAMIVISSNRLKLATILVIVFINILLFNQYFYMAVFIPSIIHVYVFTGLFMLYGALKSRSTPGYVAFFLLILFALLCLLLPTQTIEGIDQYIQSGYKTFEPLTLLLARLFHFESLSESADVYSTEAGVRIMRFIAFAYTYHYLNWFSKTSVIKWHKVPAIFVVSTIVLWIASVALYYYDYRIGIATLGFLSLLHVYLEFPLNYRSIVGISKEFRLLLHKKR